MADVSKGICTVPSASLKSYAPPPFGFLEPTVKLAVVPRSAGAGSAAFRRTCRNGLAILKP